MENKSPEATLEYRVFQFIQENRLTIPGQKILVAVSGGPDSVCLLHILSKLQGELGLRLHVAHLNHQLRGEGAEADARYVAELARRLNIPATIEKRDVAGYQSEHRLSLEEAAREVRYIFLAQTAGSLGIDRVAVGHTQNDQVETILLHIIRGTGIQGLRGLQPCHSLQFSGNRLTLIRPLLGVKRQETEEYCSQLHLSPCLDTSNLSFSLFRNRVRRELLPLLQTYNPGVFESLLRIGRISRDELSFLEVEMAKIRDKILRREGSTLVLDKNRLMALAPALQRELLRQAIDALLGTLKDIEARHIEEMLEALGKPAGKRIMLPGGMIFSIEYDRYLLGLSPQELNPLPQLWGEYDIDIPGETRVPGWNIEARVVLREEMSGSRVLDNPDRFSGYFDMDKVGNKIKVRTRRRGDRFQPLGMDCPKKVGEFMLDARIPRAWRDRIPILCSPRQIIWVAGWRIDERVKVTEETRQVLCLTMAKR